MSKCEMCYTPIQEGKELCLDCYDFRAGPTDGHWNGGYFVYNKDRVIPDYVDQKSP
jgi:hypothetical protein